MVRICPSLMRKRMGEIGPPSLSARAAAVLAGSKAHELPIYDDASPAELGRIGK